MCYSFAPGVDPELTMKMVNASIPTPPQPPPQAKPSLKLRSRRARDHEGQFQGDNPATPENEAWEDVPDEAGKT